jgi:acyl-CoA dehydrogenase
MMAGLKAKAREQGLWNCSCRPEKEHGPGLTNVEYAPLCEIMGGATGARRSSTARAPTPATWRCWRATARRRSRSAGSTPLLNGEIRSAFAMTEPDGRVERRDQHRMQHPRDGDEYVINGRKWYITGAMHERCESSS